LPGFPLREAHFRHRAVAFVFDLEKFGLHEVEAAGDNVGRE
jgi:hypothetical protein